MPLRWFMPRRRNAAPVRFYLHIGMNKTGTTGIQYALARASGPLRRHGLLYPRSGRGKGNAHYLLSHALGFAHHVPPELRAGGVRRDLRAELREEVARSGCDQVLMSSEAFVLDGDIARVREFFADWDCRIVLYLRRHDHWWASSYAQGVRTMAPPPWESGFENFLAVQQRRRKKGSYRLLADSWAEVFGADRLIVRPYEREQNQPDVVADLLGAIGRPELARFTARHLRQRNESPAPRELALIDAIQRCGLDEALRVRLVDGIRRRSDQQRGHPLIAPGLRRRLVEDNLEDYAWIARTYLGRPDGKLFLEALPDPEAAWDPEPPPTRAEIIAAAAQVLAAG